MKLSHVVVGVAVVASSSLGGVVQVGISDALDVRQPLRNSTYVEGQSEEVAGPRSIVRVFVPQGLAPEFVTDGQPITRARVEGLDFNGAVISSLAISETLQGAAAYDQLQGTMVTLDFGASESLGALFANGDLASLRIRVTTVDRDPVTNGVETAYGAGNEIGDECLDADDDAPQLVAAYRDDDHVLYLEFSEPVSNGSTQNSANQTSQALVTAADLQVNSARNLFGAATPTLSGEFILISGYADDAGRTILSYQLNADTFANVGDYIRATADDLGLPTHGVFRDVAGNEAFQQGEPGLPTMEGVQIQAGAPPGLAQSLLWVGSFSQTDFNAPTNWLPNVAPTYTTDTRMNFSGFGLVTFSEPLTVARSLWTDNIVQMRVGDDTNPDAILYLTGQESFAGVFTHAWLLQDAFNPEPSPISVVSLTEGTVDAETVGFRQNFGGSVSLTIADTGKLLTGSLQIGAPESAGVSQLFVTSGGLLATGYDNEIGARWSQSPSVIIDDSAIVGVGTDGEWLSLGDVTVNSGGQITVSTDATAVFALPVQLNGDSFFFTEDAFIASDREEGERGTFFVSDVAFQDNALLITQRLTVESGRTFEPPQLTVGLLGPEAAGAAAFEQFVAHSGSTVRPTNFLDVGLKGRLLLPDFNGVSPLPVNETEAFVDLSGGTLEVEFAEGFDPKLGSSYPIITAANYSGRFANHVLPSFGDGRVAVVTYPVPRAGNGVFYEGPRLVITDLESLLGFNPEPVVTGLEEAPVSADAGDLDGDGDTDLAIVFGNEETGSVLVLRNGGTIEGVWQGFDRGVQFATGPAPTAIAIGDFNNDTPGEGESDLDLAVSCSGDNSLRVYLNDGTASAFEQIANEPTKEFPTDVEAVDFNGDLRMDAAVVCRDADVVQIFLNAGEGVTLGGVFQAPGDVAAGDEPVDCDPVDLDNDKDVDVVTGGLGGISTSVNDGKGGFGTTSNAEIGNPVDGVANGDLDGDGDSDSAVVSREAGLLSILVNSKGALELFSTFSVGADAGSLAIIDYDADGDPDISVVSIPEGETVHRVTVLRNDSPEGGPMIFTPSVQLGQQDEPTDPRVVYSVDVDGDGRPDVVTIDGQPKGTGGAVSSYINVSGPVPLCAGDANKDRRVDGKDLQAVLGSFGQNVPAFTGGNLNGDGFVDGRDLSVVLSNYGATCEIAPLR